MADIIACADTTCSWRTTGNSRAEIVDAIYDLLTKGQNTTEELYFYYAGHGFGYEISPYQAPIDLLVGAEFARPDLTGSECVQFQEVKEILRRCMGPGVHYFFIDACRNKIKQNDIVPAPF